MRIDTLPNGYVTLIEAWGSDERIIESARMSTGKGFEGWGPRRVYDCVACGEENVDSADLYAAEGGGFGHSPLGKSCWGKVVERVAHPGDEKLLKFLWDNAHATPFEMAGATFEIQAPIFVFREWHRHRTQSYNEMSARYTPLPNVCFLSDAKDAVARSEAASKKNKQSGLVEGADALTLDAALHLLEEEASLLVMVEDLYQRKLRAGFPKELARTHLTVSRFSRMRASANLRNWLGFLTLRMAPNAQQEIRVYADAVHAHLSRVFPRTAGLFDEGRRASR